MPEMPLDRFWCSSKDTIFSQLATRETGLSTSEAKARLIRYGPNRIIEAKPRRLVLKVARRIADPLVAILLVAAIITGVTGDLPSFSVILLVVTLSLTIDVVQEHRAEVTAEALRRSVAIHADVRRNGVVVSIPVERVVPGDVVELRAGDLVPADGLILESRNAHVNAALMTGESYPVEKRPGECNASMPADAFNAVFAGTSVVSGEAIMLVVATGSRTRFGDIAAALLMSREPPTVFERGIRSLGLLILRLTIFLTLFVLLVHLALGHAVLDSFLFAVALAVGLTPELLPMIMTVTLSRGAVRMAKKRVIVKRLSAIHDLGAMDVICTDKTGTLTEAHISLLAHPGPDGKDSQRVITLAAINSQFEAGIRSPLDEAILQHMKDQPTPGWTKIDEVPFDFERRCVSVLVAKGDERLLVIKGAPESVLANVVAVDLGDGRESPLDEPTCLALERLQSERAEQGCRLLAVAWKAMPRDCAAVERGDERNLVLAGFCVFVDPPKSSAADAIVRLVASGVRVKVVSGDHDTVVRYVAKALKIPAHDLLTGAEIAALNDRQLAARVDEVDLYARIDPDQKTRIVEALRARGHIVGFIGDGVNDAPAIRAADVGVSVDGATDVARAAADIILLAPDLGVLADGIMEGRRTFANILKYVRMGTSSNFGNMLSMALASLVLPFLPLLPIQILLNNLIYDLSEIGIPFDGVDPDDVAITHAWDMKAILRFTLVMGAVSSLFDIATFAVLRQILDAGPDLFRTAWFLESMATQILVIFIIRTHRNMWESQAHPALVVTSLGALAVAFAVTLSPFGAIFGFVRIPAVVVFIIAGIVLVYLVTAEYAKRIANHGFGRKN